LPRAQCDGRPAVETHRDVVADGQKMNAGAGTGRDPIARTQCLAALDQAVGKEQQRRQRPVGDTCGAAAAGQAAVDVGLDRPSGQLPAEEIRQFRADHQAGIVAEVADHGARAERTQVGQRTAGDLDGRVHGGDERQQAGYVLEAGVHRKRVAHQERELGFRRGIAAFDDRHVDRVGAGHGQ
jgi:hypothetical protein